MSEQRPPGMPRWVKVVGIVFIVLLLLFVILRLTGLHTGGPGRHIPSGDAGGRSTTQQEAPPTGDTGGHTPPIQHGVPQQ